MTTRFLALLLCVACAGTVAAKNSTRFTFNDSNVVCYKAIALPSKSVPPITRWSSDESKAPSGDFYIAVNISSGDAAFLQVAKRVDKLFMTHLHLGNSSTNGPVLVPLTPGTPVVNGVLPQFVPPLTSEKLEAYAVIDDALFTGPLNGDDFTGLIELAEEGNVYVNFHTTAYPAGVMRGQLRRYKCSDGEMKDLLSWS